MAQSGLRDYIKENARILDIAQKYGIQIQRNTQRHAFALCPWCGDDEALRERKFKIQFYLDTDSFSCHKCKRSGDVFSLVELMEPCDFIMALTVLARIVGRDVTDKEIEHYKANIDVWQIPSIYRFILNQLTEETYEYDDQKFSAQDMARKYLSSRGITNPALVDDYEIIYVDIKKKLLPLLLQETKFTEQAIANSGILVSPDFFWRDSILIPMHVDHKIRQFTSLSCGMVTERRTPKALNMNNIGGYSPRRVWGLDKIFDLDPKGVFVCESTTDALSIMQAYYNKQITIPAIALGSQNISELQLQEITRFPKMNYFILFDHNIGEGEQIAANQLAARLSYDCFVVNLPIRKPREKGDPKDVNDLLQLPDNSVHLPQQFQGMSFAQRLAKAVKLAIDEKITPPIEVDITDLLFAEYMNKRIITKAMPFSDIISTHSVPVAVRVYCKGIQHCDTQTKNKCALSRCGRKGKLLEIELDDPEILRFCHTKKEQEISAFWIKMLAPPCKPKYIEIETERTASVHQMEIGPNIEYLTGFEKVNRFILIRTYIINVESEELPNIEPIEITGRLVPHPFDNHEVTLLATKFEKLKDAIDLFELTAEVKESLAKFQQLSLSEILEDIVNYTGIIESPEMHLAALLTYHSALHYEFLGADYLGCVHALLLCDTSTGKTIMAQRLINLFRLGERIVGETAGRTGVTYSIVQTGRGRWVVRWGAMPRNDRGFLMFDEYQAFPEGESDNIKEARSSGQLRVDRAAKSFAYTRNRILFAANPKPRYRGASTQLFSFDYPIEAIRTIFITEADIRRLDLVVLVRGTDRPTEMLHREIYIDESKSKITGVDWRNSVRWAWKRTKEDIIITRDALTHLLQVRSPEIVDKFKFAEDIPLFSASHTKHTILKLAIALASLLKSTDETFEKVIVLKLHIDAICDWLNDLYSSTGVRLDSYANKRRQEIYMTDDDFDEMIGQMSEGNINSRAGSIHGYLSMWMDNESWNTHMLKEAVDIDQKLLKKFNRIALTSKLLTKRGSNLNKTPKMAEFIKRFEDKVYANPSWGLDSDDMVAPDFGDILKF